MAKKNIFTLSTVGLTVILSILVGGLSGIVASVLADRSIDSYIQQLAEDAQFFSLSEVKPRPLPGSYEESLERVQEVASPATASIRSKTVDASNVANWVRVGESDGIGAVITSDGWILFHASALTSFESPISQAEVWVESERFSIEEILEDPLSEVVMLKVEAQDLPSVDFGSTQDMEGGEILFASSSDGLVHPASLLQANVYSPELSLPAEEFISSW